MILKLLQDIGVFNVDVLFTFLNIYFLGRNNALQHSHRKSWQFLPKKLFSIVQKFE